MANEFNIQCAVLADLWMNYRDGDEFEDFISYNDIGLPLAYFVASDLVKPSDLAVQYVIETFELLCAALHLPLDGEYETLEQMLDLASKLDN